MRRSHPTSHPAFPHVIGVPGGSLVDLSSGDKFGEKATIGQMGELQTAKVLDAYCDEGGPTVLHDLVLPMRNITANIDHVVISGQQVYIIDTKAWKPGRIWTFRGTTRRGWEPFPPGDKKTLRMANESVSALLHQAGVRFKMQQPLMVIWPSNQSKRLSTTWFSPVGASPVKGPKLAGHIRHAIPHRQASPDIVRELVDLVIAVRKNKTLRTAGQYQSDDF